jgi:hypothetical protein
MLGVACIDLRRFKEAVAAATKALRKNKTFGLANRCLAAALAHLGRDAEAKRMVAQILVFRPPRRAVWFSSAIKVEPNMAKSIKVEPKKRGRPATGKDPLMGFRASPMMRASVVRWAENQPDTPSLSEAIRRLVEMGLKAKGK